MRLVVVVGNLFKLDHWGMCYCWVIPALCVYRRGCRKKLAETLTVVWIYYKLRSDG